MCDALPATGLPPPPPAEGLSELHEDAVGPQCFCFAIREALASAFRTAHTREQLGARIRDFGCTAARPKSGAGPAGVPDDVPPALCDNLGSFHRALGVMYPQAPRPHAAPGRAPDSRRPQGEPAG